LLFNSGPTNFIDNGKIDARCNTYAIIIYCVLAPISHEGIILSHVIIFHEQNEIKQTLFRTNLDGHPKVPCGSLVDFAWLIMARTTSCTNFSNFPKMKLVRDLNRLGVAHMVIRMSCTTTSGLTDCPLSSSNSVDVKYSQVLTQGIVAYTTI
jgi:hypothetical protein